MKKPLAWPAVSAMNISETDIDGEPGAAAHKAASIPG